MSADVLSRWLASLESDSPPVNVNIKGILLFAFFMFLGLLSPRLLYAIVAASDLFSFPGDLQRAVESDGDEDGARAGLLTFIFLFLLGLINEDVFNAVNAAADILPFPVDISLVVQPHVFPAGGPGFLQDWRSLPLPYPPMGAGRIVRRYPHAPGGRDFTAEEKFGIIMAVLNHPDQVGEICSRHGISAATFLTWVKELLRARTVTRI